MGGSWRHLHAKENYATVQLGFRLVHILRRLMPAALYLLQRDGQFLTGHDLFLKRVGASFHAFIEVCVCSPCLMSTPLGVEAWSGLLRVLAAAKFRAGSCELGLGRLGGPVRKQ